MCGKSKLKIWTALKSVCLGKVFIQAIIVPVSLVTARLLSMVIDEAVKGNVETTVVYSLTMLGLIIVLGVIQMIGKRLILRCQTKALNQCRVDFLEFLLNNPLEKLYNTDYGELNENLNSDLEAFSKRYIDTHPNVIISVIGLLGYFFFLLLQSPVAAVSLLGIAFLQLIPPIIVKKYLQINYDQCREIEAQITNHIVEAVDGFEIIKLYGLKQWWKTKMTDYHRKYISVGRKADATAAAQRSMYKLLDNVLKFGTYALMGWYVMVDVCSLEVSVQAIYLSTGLFESVKSLFSVIPEFAVSRKAEERISKWIVVDDGEKDLLPYVEKFNNKPLIIKNIHYRYGKKKVFDGLNYQFYTDKNYAIEGCNGVGKTTLINLIMGLLVPDQGEIFVGDFEPWNIGGEHTFMYIPQCDPEYSFDVQTLFEMFGEEKQERLYSIAKRLGLSEAIMHGTEICSLSGGERKKVFLAIGFAMHPQWLLLDEPSNNLDNQGKDALAELINERKRVIMVSHDPSLMHGIDCRINFENGRVCDENR